MGLFFQKKRPKIGMNRSVLYANRSATLQCLTPCLAIYVEATLMLEQEATRKKGHRY